jgi:hypothetical protein
VEEELALASFRTSQPAMSKGTHNTDIGRHPSAVPPSRILDGAKHKVLATDSLTRLSCCFSTSNSTVPQSRKS